MSLWGRILSGEEKWNYWVREYSLFLVLREPWRVALPTYSHPPPSTEQLSPPHQHSRPSILNFSQALFSCSTSNIFCSKHQTGEVWDDHETSHNFTLFYGVIPAPTFISCSATDYSCFSGDHQYGDHTPGLSLPWLQAQDVPAMMGTRWGGPQYNTSSRPGLSSPKPTCGWSHLCASFTSSRKGHGFSSGILSLSLIFYCDNSHTLKALEKGIKPRPGCSEHCGSIKHGHDVVQPSPPSVSRALISPN